VGKRTLRVAMQDLLDAIEEWNEQAVHYFNRRTGEVVRFDPELDSPEVDPDDDPDLVVIPNLESHDAFRVMERFVDGIDELDVQRQLRRSLEGKGAFRRFRETLAGFPDLRGRWETTHREDLLQRALEFLDELDIEPIDELRSPSTAPAQATPPKHPRVLLHHLLLLGAPDGKTELIEGRVVRRVRARSPQQARKLFAGLAREIMEVNGLGWRRSAVERLPEIEVGPFRLAVEDDVVWLRTEVTREIWDEFAR
jgi:hypothetical protein